MCRFGASWKGIWITYFLRASTSQPVRRHLLMGSLWFGLLLAVIQWALYGQPPSMAAGYVLVGGIFAIAGSITLLTGNAWGTALFWTVSNF